MCQWVTNPIPLYCNVNGICWLNPRCHSHHKHIPDSLFILNALIRVMTSELNVTDRDSVACLFLNWGRRDGEKRLCCYILLRSGVFLWVTVSLHASTCFTIYHKYVFQESNSVTLHMHMLQFTPSWNYFIGLQDYFWIHAVEETHLNANKLIHCFRFLQIRYACLRQRSKTKLFTPLGHEHTSKEKPDLLCNRTKLKQKGQHLCWITMIQCSSLNRNSYKDVLFGILQF